MTIRQSASRDFADVQSHPSCDLDASPSSVCRERSISSHPFLVSSQRTVDCTPALPQTLDNIARLPPAVEHALKRQLWDGEVIPYATCCVCARRWARQGRTTPFLLLPLVHRRRRSTRRLPVLLLKSGCVPRRSAAPPLISTKMEPPQCPLSFPPLNALSRTLNFLDFRL